MDKYGDVSVAVNSNEHVATVEIHRPPNNYFDDALIRNLADAFETLDKDPACRAILLAAEGKSFCAGANFQSRPETNPLNQSQTASGSNPLYLEAVRLFRATKPVVAAIQGAAVGAGLGLALVADFRVAAPEARFAANFVKLSFHPGFGLTLTLPRLVGEQRAALMLLTGRRIKADEALSWGLVDDVAPQAELRERALSLARELAGNAPLAVVATRKTLRGALASAVRERTTHEG